ncbi:MAG: hypothetical protein IPG39_15535 [Bacteroidetes bacterium]|nr:hypothetical protein [Bacteroidota bacterium]
MTGFVEESCSLIHNITGKKLAFGARILKTDAKAAKYLNSPESDIYHKSKILYMEYTLPRNLLSQRMSAFQLRVIPMLFPCIRLWHRKQLPLSGTSRTVEQIR